MPRVSEAAVTLECKLRHKYNIKDRWEELQTSIKHRLAACHLPASVCNAVWNSLVQLAVMQ